MSTPRVSVIIATYNRSAALRLAASSVLAQTFADFELLIIGDACTDDSAHVVCALADARVRWINLRANTGHQSAPNNRGLHEAVGEYIAYLGHDDLWLPHHLECMVGALDEGADVAMSLAGYVEKGSATCRPYVPILEKRHWSPPTTTAHRRSILSIVEGWRDYRDIRQPPDTDFWCRMHAAGLAFRFVPRLTGLKFAAGPNVYSERPSHEQAAWLERISADPTFEPVELVRMVANGQAARATPGRLLFPIALEQLRTRTAFRFSPRRALNGLRKGGSIRAARRMKGLKSDD